MKKRKLKTKNVIILISIILILVIIKPSIYLYNVLQIKNIGYSYDIAKIIYRSDAKKYISNHKYNVIIQDYISSKDFNIEYIEEYYEIKHIKIKDFLKVINLLLDNNYSAEEINLIINYYDDDLINYLINNKIEDINEYFKFEFFKSQNIDRYIKYFNGNYKDTIIKVNIGLDNPFYENENIIVEYSRTMIVNKYNKLNENFTPDNLTKVRKCSDGNHYLTEETKIAYEKMCDDMNNLGYKISINSAYRSYENQKDIYNYYLKNNGKSYVDKYVAIPGYSEHQTGLALDIKSMNSNIFQYSNEYKYLKDNAYKYGFILRYQNGTENITGYAPEAWHFRYVGNEIAKYIYENNITYEEYYAMFQ